MMNLQAHPMTICHYLNKDKTKKGKYTSYYNEFICLDTETSHNEENGWINSIQLLIGEDCYIQLRKPSELIELLQGLTQFMEIDNDNRMVIYVHNLSYDICYLQQWLYKAFGQCGERHTLLTGPHKYIYTVFGGFEFRCSYRLSGRSLEKWCNDLNTTHKKIVGTYDYNKIIYQDTEFTEIEKEYDKEDVYSLRECIVKTMEMYDDTIATIPYTSTGYVRRDILRCFQNNLTSNHFDFSNHIISVDCYKNMNQLKNGAITHGNRFLRNKHLKNIKGRHVDLISAYPSATVCYEYPIGKWFRREYKTIKECLDLTKKYCLMVKIVLQDVSIKDGVTLPFLQAYKCDVGKKTGYKSCNDNGRVLYTKGQCEIVLSDIMLKIILEQYNFKYKIIEVWQSRKGMLPSYIIESTKKYFYNKTKYKNIVKKMIKEYGELHEKTIDAQINLLESKKLLNAIYGVLYEDFVKDIFEFDYYLNQFLKNNIHKNDKEISVKINEHYSKWNKYNRMEFGWYTTEIVKKQIYDTVVKIGYENFIYCDTDSIFYIETEENKNVLQEVNKELRKIAIDHEGYIEYDGKKTWFNGFDFEENYHDFKFLHSKCYCLTTDNDEFICTVAGVPRDNKKKGVEKITREMELCGCYDSKKYNKEMFKKGYDNFKPSFVFRECGSTTSKYVCEEPKTVLIDGHLTEIANACIISNVNKTLKDVNDISFLDFYKMIVGE